MSVYALTGLALSAPLGRLMERRPGLVLGMGMTAFVAGNLVVLAAAALPWAALAGRGLEAAGYAVFGLAGPVIANRSAGAHHLPIIAGLTAAWVPIGQIVALVIAWPLLETGEWQPIWWAGLLLTAATGAWLWQRRRATLPLLGHMGQAIGHGRLARREWAVLVLTACVFGLWSGQYTAFMTWLPDNLVLQHELKPETAALINTVPVLGVLIMCIVTGFLLRAGFSFTALFVGATVVQVPVWLWAAELDPLPGLAAIALYGLSSGITPVCLFALPGRLLGGHRVTAGAFAPIMMGRNMGILVAPIVLGAVSGPTLGWDLVWPLFAGLTALSALGALVVGLSLARARRK
jgi:MFS family permease